MSIQFGAQANFSASFGAQVAPQHQGCRCGTTGYPQPQPSYPSVPSFPSYPSYPAQPQQPQISAQFQVQMMMSYFMNMMASMSQLQQGFGSFMGQQPSPYQLPTGGGYGGGYGGSGHGGGYAQIAPQPAPYVPAPAPAPAPKAPAKKGGYA